MNKTNEKKSTKIAAVIEIDSTFVKLKLSQLKKGKPSDLENLESPLHIGSQICASGKIGQENIRELIKVLRGYGKIVQDYGVEACQVAAGFELFSAENQVFILERVKSRSGFTPKLYGFGLKNALICQEAMRSCDIYQKEGSGSEIVADIENSTVGVTVFTNGRAAFVRALPVGPLRLSQLFSTVQDMPDVADAAQEYVDRLFELNSFSKQADKTNPLLILTGHAVGPIARLCGAENRQRLEPEKIKSLFERMRGLTPDRIGMRFDMPEKDAERLYFMLAAARSLIKAFSPAAVLVSETDLADALVRQFLLPKERSLFQNQIRESAVSSARRLVRQNGRESTHAEFVRKLSCKIFERLQKEYGLDGEKRLALELSAILKEYGRPIVDETIYGIEESTSELISIVMKETQDSPDGRPADGRELAAFRISAILNIAEALDSSGKQKLENIKIKVEKGKLNMTAECREGTALEKWALGNTASFFTEVFGLVPVLTVKFASAVR